MKASGQVSRDISRELLAEGSSLNAQQIHSLLNATHRTLAFFAMNGNQAKELEELTISIQTERSDPSEPQRGKTLAGRPKQRGGK